jgi:hypothetical protein
VTTLFTQILVLPRVEVSGVRYFTFSMRDFLAFPLVANSTKRLKKSRRLGSKELPTSTQPCVYPFAELCR